MSTEAANVNEIKLSLDTILGQNEAEVGKLNLLFIKLSVS
jgi:hypothetical protein